jgi:hypothetical protein
MTGKILITTLLGVAALGLAAPAAPVDQPRGAPSARVASPEHADFWNYESGAKVADSSPRMPPQDLATLYSGSAAPTAGSVTVSDSEIEWPQVGIGFGVGILLALGVGMSVRAARTRPILY